MKRTVFSFILLVFILLLVTGCDSKTTVKSIEVNSFFFDSTLSIPIQATGTFGTGEALFTTKQKSDNAVAVFKNAIENLNDGYQYSCDSFEDDALAIKQVLTSRDARYFMLSLLDTGEILITDSRIEIISNDNMETGTSTLLIFPYHLLAEQSFKSAFANLTMTYDTVYTVKTSKSPDDFYDFYSSTGQYTLEKFESGFRIIDDYGSGYTALVFDFTQINDSFTLSVHMA